MDRKKTTLQLLKKRGDKGVSTEELAKKFNYGNRNSASKLMWLLRADGHKIQYDKGKGVHILKENNKKIYHTEVRSKDMIETIKKDSENSDDIRIKSPAELAGMRPDTRKALAYNMLVSRGKEGATPEEIANVSDTKRDNVCYQIHALRRDIGCKIEMVSGRYILKNRNLPTYGSNAITVSDSDNILNKIGNKKLVMGIHKVRAEDQEAYLDLLRNIIYYTKCAESMLETTQLLDAVKKEVSPL